MGVPAELVSRFLGTRGIVVEKTGDYTLLFGAGSGELKRTGEMGRPGANVRGA